MRSAFWSATRRASPAAHGCRRWRWRSEIYSTATRWPVQWREWTGLLPRAFDARGGLRGDRPPGSGDVRRRRSLHAPQGDLPRRPAAGGRTALDASAQPRRGWSDPLPIAAGARAPRGPDHRLRFGEPDRGSCRRRCSSPRAWPVLSTGTCSILCMRGSSATSRVPSPAMRRRVSRKRSNVASPSGWARLMLT